MKTIDKFIYRGLLLLIGLLPFHAFLKTWLTSLLTESSIDYLSQGSFLIGTWKEILILILAVLVLWKIWKEGKLPFALHKIDWTLIVFTSILLISPLWTKFDLEAYVWAVKTDLSAILVYFIVRSISWQKEQIHYLLKVILTSASVVVVWGLILYFFLPSDFLQHFGYTPYISSYVDYKPLPFVHGMGENLTVARLASTLSGPNQLASYLLIILGLVFSSLFYKKYNWKIILLGIGSFSCLILSFSRAAWIGFLIASLIVLSQKLDLKKHLKKILIVLTCCLILFLLALSNTSFRNDYIWRASSSMGHFEESVKGLEIVTENPFGLGMGQAGPVSRRIYGEEAGIISENWYLQIAQEAGIPALFLWFYIIALFINRYWKNPNYLNTASLFVLVAISVDALFLHAWTDSVTALMMFVLLGIGFRVSGSVLNPDPRPQTQNPLPKIALAHDFLTYLGGAERVLKVLADTFSEAPIYTLLYDEQKMGKDFPAERVHTSNLQKSIFKNKKQFLLTRFPVAVEQFDFSEYDLVLSSSGAWMKGVLTKPETKHICYCHGPMRFAWDRQAEYLASKNISGLKKYLVLKLLNKVRNWDKISSDRPDLYLANSKAIKKLIAKNYKLEANVLYPPVDVKRFEVSKQDKGYYLIISRLSPYKNIELAVKAFADLPDKELLIVGTGEQLEYLKKIASPNVKLLGFKSDEETKEYFENCHAFLFPGEDDFGITPVEAMACGKPVLAFARGGALETVIEGQTGIFFRENTKESFLAALQKLENTTWDSDRIRKRAEEFSTETFVRKVKKIVNSI